MQASQLRRRLESSSVDQLAAEKACEHWGEGKDDCVSTLTTGDPEMAVVGAYLERSKNVIMAVLPLLLWTSSLPVGVAGF
jgi:hypothetical protein